MNHKKPFRKAVQQDSERQRLAEREPASLLGMLTYGGVIGLLLVLPAVGGAYLGRWLDSLSEGYQTRWTVSLIILGIVAGIWNVYWYIKERL